MQITINIPENPTNGDIIKAVFPYVRVERCDETTDIYRLDGVTAFNNYWLDVPYERNKGAQEEL